MGSSARVAAHFLPCNHTMLCHGMPCCAMLCHAVPCCAMLCHPMPCYAMLCHAMQWRHLIWPVPRQPLQPYQKSCGAGEAAGEGEGEDQAMMRHTMLNPSQSAKQDCTAADSERGCCFTCQRWSGRWSGGAPQSLGSPAGHYSYCVCPLKAAYQAPLDWPHLSNTRMKACVSK